LHFSGHGYFHGYFLLLVLSDSRNNAKTLREQVYLQMLGIRGLRIRG